MKKNASSQLTIHGLSTPKIIAGAIDLVRAQCPDLKDRKIRHLDVGAGNGELIEYLSRFYEAASSACDYTDTLMQLPEQKIDICDLNHERLPYEDNFFDLVTLTEVIEHISNHRLTLREIYRVLKPGGSLVVTTPNILNIKSRLRFLCFGFWTLFGPMPFRGSTKYSSAGHINPISYYYVASALIESGFSIIAESIDKVQRSGLLPLAFLYFPIKIFGGMAFRAEDRNHQNIDARNRELVKKMNSPMMLLGRTIIVLARKPQRTLAAAGD